MARPAHRVPSFVALLTALLLVGPAVSGQTAPHRYTLFGTFYLELDGKRVDEARLYHSRGYGAVLVRAPKLSPFVVKPRGQLVEIYQAESLSEHPDGTVEIPTGTAPASSTTFTLDADSTPVFTVDGQRARLIAKPPLLGPHTRESLLAHDPSYRLKAVYYQPTLQYVEALRQTSGPIRVKVYLGTWCSVCAELMPHIVRVEEELAGSEISFEYYGLPENYDDPEARRLGITQVPTGILYREGEEIGRIVQWSWRHPDMALVNTLSGAGVAVP